MKLENVLVVFKKSTFQLQAVEFKEPRFLKLLEEGHVSVAKVKNAHEQHLASIDTVERTLKERHIAFDLVHRAELADKAHQYDMLISIGGDGTFLDASHSLKNVPILGVNSAPGTSFGHFSISNSGNFARIIDSILAGDTMPQRLLRLQLSIDGIDLPELVLNEVLMAHSNPAGTSRYILRIGDQAEEQRSSGIWIGTPSGSTGAIKSAGGEILPITSEYYEYVVREKWERPGQKFALVSGKLPKTQKMSIVSQMRTGAIYIDGQHIEYPFQLGEELCVRAAEHDLLAFVDPEVNRIFETG